MIGDCDVTASATRFCQDTLVEFRFLYLSHNAVRLRMALISPSDMMVDRTEAVKGS